MISRIFIFSAFIFFGLSCSSDDDAQPVPPNEEEVITKLTYTLISQSEATEIVEFSFEDRDGEGGNPATIINAVLKPSTTYSGTVTVENTIDPLSVIDITEEVEEEAEDHQFFYTTTAIQVEISYDSENDVVDQNNNPVGIRTILRTGLDTNGSLRVILRHQPDKTAEGLRIDNPDMAGGESDIDVTFSVVVDGSNTVINE